MARDPISDAIEHTLFQQIDIGTAEHLPLQHFQTVDLPFNWPRTPRQGDARFHRLFTRYCESENVYRRDQSSQDVSWLGKLALLHLGGIWWEQADGLHFFSRLVEEHNQLFGFY